MDMSISISLRGRLIIRITFLIIMFLSALLVNYNNLSLLSDLYKLHITRLEGEKQAADLKYRSEILFEKQAALLSNRNLDVNKCRDDISGFKKGVEYVINLAETGEEKKMARDLITYSENYIQNLTDLILFFEEPVGFPPSQTSGRPVELYTQLDAGKKNLSGIIDYFIQSYGGKHIEATQRINQQLRFVHIIVMGTFLLAAILYVVMSMLLAIRFTKPMSALVKAAKKASCGDLTQKIPVTSNEIGQLADAFKSMIRQIRELIRQIADKTTVLSGSAHQLNSISRQTTAGAAANAATIQEISEAVKQIISNINEISTASEIASDQAMKGKTGIGRVVGQMRVIASSAAEMSRVIYGLNEKTQEIDQIVELITSIAEQTNLLALNAAIEAARAGPQGKGFVVVAEEVKKLAERSAGAAKDIHHIISGIQLESQRAVLSMAEGDKEVEAGSRIVGEVGNNFNEIINAVQSLNSQIKDVSLAARQLSAGVQDVTDSTAIQKLTMQKVSDHAGSLSGLAEELNQLVGKFRVEAQQ